MDLKSFSRRMSQLGERVDTNANKLKRKVALAVDQVVVLATPVDTGRARANWQVSVGTAPSDVIDAFSQGKGGSTAAQNTQAALDQGKIAIDSAAPGQEIHITNNLSYIGKLNDGHSAQAPAGFVQQGVQVGSETVRGAKILE